MKWRIDWYYEIVKSLAETWFLRKDVRKTIKNEAKAEFFEMLLSTLGASSSGNILSRRIY